MAVSYPASIYDPQSPSTKRNAKLTQQEWLDVIDEVGAVETELGKNHAKRGHLNWVKGGNVESWSAGASAAPDGWTLSGAAATVSRQADGQDSQYAAQITAGTAASKLAQTVHATISATQLARWRGRPVTLAARVKTSTASAARIGIADGVGTTYSSYHAGDGAYAWLTVTRTLDSTATSLSVELNNDKTDSATTVKFDSVMLVEGEFSNAAQAWQPSPFDHLLHVSNFQSTTPTNNTDQGVFRAEIGEVSVTPTTAISTATTAVTFQTAFRTVRIVLLTPTSEKTGNKRSIWNAESVLTTGFTARVSSADAANFGTTTAGTAYWVAIGSV